MFFHIWVKFDSKLNHDFNLNFRFEALLLLLNEYSMNMRDTPVKELEAFPL